MSHGGYGTPAEKKEKIVLVKGVSRVVSSVIDDRAERHIGIQDDDAWKKKKKETGVAYR